MDTSLQEYRSSFNYIVVTTVAADLSMQELNEVQLQNQVFIVTYTSRFQCMRLFRLTISLCCRHFSFQVTSQGPPTMLSDTLIVYVAQSSSNRQYLLHNVQKLLPQTQVVQTTWNICCSAHYIHLCVHNMIVDYLGQLHSAIPSQIWLRCTEIFAH